MALPLNKYNKWIADDEADRLAIEVTLPQIGNHCLQLDDNSTWMAIKHGHGAEIWEEKGPVRLRRIESASEPDLEVNELVLWVDGAGKHYLIIGDTPVNYKIELKT